MDNWLLILGLFTGVCAFIGYITNVVAVKMIFRPHERKQWLGVGYQGVLPKHQRHFAEKLADVAIGGFLTMEDLVAALDRAEVTDEVERMARDMVDDVVAEVKAVVPPPQQMLLSPMMVQGVVEQVVAQARARTPEIVREFQSRATETLSLKEVITEKLMLLGPAGLERVFYQVSGRELRFIEYYGGIFGFMLGGFQFAVLHLFGDWVLPVVGCIVGTVTNELAIQMLFKPQEPKKYFGLVTYQGMIPKRQREMAAVMGAIAAAELIIPEEIYGRLADELLPELVGAADVAQVEAILRKEAPQVFLLADALVPEANRPELRERLAGRASERLPGVKEQVVRTAAAHVDIDGLLTSRIQELKKSEFGELLRSLIKREELYLILYGGLLGGLIGGLQWLMVSFLG